ncbi:MAG: TonB-dependent receptor, partial [Acidobacteria bacterium]|nr:TonB-dependent receptor [Acidobacteriota bacterium]
TQARRRLSVTRQDQVGQTSAGAYGQAEIEWAPHVRTVLGLRGDVYWFDVTSDDPRNSGTASDALLSPKASVIFGPWSGTEFYINTGSGFHSNDARGATITVDPVSGEPVERVTPLAQARGAEIGLRTVRLPGVQSTVTVWTLGIDSELLFVGDAGATEASRPSRRYGVEWTNYVQLRPWLTLDADVSFSRARFTDDDPTGDRIAGAVAQVAALGVSVEELRRVFGSVRLRYFGARPLVEDGTVRSDATTLVNVQAGYRLSNRARLVVDVFNLLDAEDSDIDYFYASRLPGEGSEGVQDIHFHRVWISLGATRTG